MEKAYTARWLGCKRGNGRMDQRERLEVFASIPHRLDGPVTSKLKRKRCACLNLGQTGSPHRPVLFFLSPQLTLTLGTDVGFAFVPFLAFQTALYVSTVALLALHLTVSSVRFLAGKR